MTNRNMVKPDAAAKPSRAQQAPSTPRPAPEDSRTPTTREEAIDSPQPNASAKREPPAPGEIGLATKRRD